MSFDTFIVIVGVLWLVWVMWLVWVIAYKWLEYRGPSP